MNRRFVTALTALSVLGVANTSCRGQTSEEPPIAILRNMHFQQRFDSQSRNTFFADQRAMRPEEEGTVSRESMPAGYLSTEQVSQGLNPDGSGYVAQIPNELIADFGGMEKVVARGQNRYAIYCTPCHGRAGDGLGIVYVRGIQTHGYVYPQPATFHQDRVQHMPDGQMFATITNGIRNMPSYAAQIPVKDRWAIISYVRALQVSQAATATATPTGAAH